MRNAWKDLSVSKKLMAVVGLMAVLIALELLTLMFAMRTLSATRAFVEGEANWSKAQKNATYSLHQYALTRDPKYFQEFQQNLLVPMGDRQARLELLSGHPNMDLVYKGFSQGLIHPDDIPGVVNLLTRFNQEPHIRHAIQIWSDADAMLDELIASGNEIDQAIRQGRTGLDDLQKALGQLEILNKHLTALEMEFSATLGEASRWLENVLMLILFCAVLTVEATGLLLTFSFSRNLARSLGELKTGIDEIGQGHFDQRLPVRSGDELGRLAAAINQMAADLKTNIGQRQQAEKANRVKSAFLANMSHEIRTPLGVIMGLAEVLKTEEPTPAERANYLDVISETGYNLSRIINDILDLSKVEAGHLEIEKSTFSLPDFLTEISTMLTVQAERKGNRLFFESDGTKMIRTDRVRLRQILVNLIGNALKFTQGGDVSTTVKQVGTDLHIEVTDTGQGISEARVAELFLPFSQTDDSPERRAEGTGLGLVLAKRLSVALGGDVTLKRTGKDEGSTFLVQIQNDLSPTEARGSVGLSPAHSHASNELPHSMFLKGKKVLVVDDSPDNRLLIRALLSRTGAEIQMKNDGQQGADAALAEKFDLILMDMQMPVMDGYSATRLLREKGLQTPIIALTAHAMKEDRDRCLMAGCSEYLSKPIDNKLFYATIAQVLSP